MDSDTALLLNRTGITADGCICLLSSKIEFLISRRCLTIFTPPAVDPAEAPVKSKKKNNMVVKGDHTV